MDALFCMTWHALFHHQHDLHALLYLSTNATFSPNFIKHTEIFITTSFLHCKKTEIRSHLFGNSHQVSLTPTQLQLFRRKNTTVLFWHSIDQLFYTNKWTLGLNIKIQKKRAALLESRSMNPLNKCDNLLPMYTENKTRIYKLLKPFQQ